MFTEQKELAYDEFIALLDNLYTGDVFDEEIFGSLLLSAYGEHRGKMDLGKMGERLEYLSG